MHEVIPGRPLDEDIALAVLIEKGVQQLPGKLETVRDVSYKGVGEDSVGMQSVDHGRTHPNGH